jgi:hypothetical protein
MVNCDAQVIRVAVAIWLHVSCPSNRSVITEPNIIFKIFLINTSIPICKGAQILGVRLPRGNKFGMVVPTWHVILVPKG